MGPRCRGCGAYGDVPGLCAECSVKAVQAPERVRWYCHTCHRTHSHTPAERDTHRDEIRAGEAARLTANARPCPGRDPVTRDSGTPACAEQCRRTLVAGMAERGIEVAATWAPPLFPSPYEPLNMRCPHGVLWFMEPTAEGRAALARPEPSS